MAKRKQNKVPVEKKAELKVEPQKKEPNWMAKIVNVDILNIRIKPNGEIISQLNKGTFLKLVSKTIFTDDKMCDWYHVITPFGQDGWAMSQFLMIFEDDNFTEV